MLPIADRVLLFLWEMAQRLVGGGCAVSWKFLGVGNRLIINFEGHRGESEFGSLFIESLENRQVDILGDLLAPDEISGWAGSGSTGLVEGVLPM